MSNLSANTLFHFTRNKEALISILKTKFYPRLCQEEMVLFKGKGKVGYPMVCFCDIPLSQIENHTNTYGKYAIGLRKTWAIKLGITPILYTHLNSLVCSHLRNNIGKILLTQNMDLLDEMYISFFMKPYNGMQLVNGKKKRITFYNEREWRYIPPKEDLIIRNGGEADLEQIGIFIEDLYHAKSPELIQSDISLLNARNEQFGLSFTPKDINYIIVERESEILEIMDTVQNIKGNFSHNDVKLLSTRIISMERISEDF